jgi:hypothetical protein
MRSEDRTDRRGFLRNAALTGAGLALGGGHSAEAETPAGAREPIRLHAGPQLFLDDHLIASSEGLKRVIRQPQRLPRPIVTGSEDRCFQPYLTVLRDEKTGRFRIWYNASTDPPDAGAAHIATMESEDGIHWIRPHRVLAEPANVVFGCTVLDEGSGFADAARRYRLAWWNQGLWIAFSPDGLAWKSAQARPVLKDIEDIVFLARDPIRQRYLLTCKLNSRPEDGYKGSTPNASEGTRRLVGQSVSPDCVRWEAARRIIVPDSRDEGITEFYSIGGVIERGGLLIGLLKVLRDDLACDPGGPKQGIGYTVLAWSRDGETWVRDREPFLQRNLEPKSWDHAMTWGDYQLIVGDETYLYYGGYARGHKVERFSERQIGLARMPRDRYVARTAPPGSRGSLLTRPFVLGGSRLTVNANVAGSLRVGVLDAAGKPVSGFRESREVAGDSLAHPVRWERSLAALKGKPVRLGFAVDDGELYGFEIAR